VRAPRDARQTPAAAAYSQRGGRPNAVGEGEEEDDEGAKLLPAAPDVCGSKDRARPTFSPSLLPARPHFHPRRWQGRNPSALVVDEGARREGRLAGERGVGGGMDAIYRRRRGLRLVRACNQSPTPFLEECSEGVAHLSSLGERQRRVRFEGDNPALPALVEFSQLRLVAERRSEGRKNSPLFCCYYVSR